MAPRKQWILVLTMMGLMMLAPFVLPATTAQVAEVVIADFHAEPQPESSVIFVIWSTSSEAPGYVFGIAHTTDGSTWVVEPMQVDWNTDGVAKTYYYFAAMLPGVTEYGYRLTLTDIAGSVVETRNIEVHLEPEATPTDTPTLEPTGTFTPTPTPYPTWTPAPDLAIDGLRYASDQVTLLIGNQSTVRAGQPIFSGLYVDRAPAGMPDNQTFTLPMGAGQVAEVVLPWQHQQGLHLLTVYVDWPDSIAEQNELNNQRWLVVLDGTPQPPNLPAVIWLPLMIKG